MAIEEITKLVEESVTSEVFGVWFLIGAALVFFMQAGFAMVETGFTRAKKCRQHYYEKSDGFLHRNGCVRFAWLQPDDGRRLCPRNFRSTEP